MLKVQRRHRPPCKKPMWDAGYTKCRCPIVIRGTLAGKHITVSTAKYLPPERSRSLEAAQELALLWQRSGRPVHPSASDPQPDPVPEVPARTTIEQAARSYAAQAKDIGNGRAQTAKKKLWIERRLVAFAREKGIRYLGELDIATMREWRSTWKVGDLARSIVQTMVIGFLRDCERSDLLPPNFTARIAHGMGRIKVQRKQTDYFTPPEYAAILAATWRYCDRPQPDPRGGDRIRTLTELMRWTGLRIGDAATLERRRLVRDQATGIWSVLLYQRKTGDPVYCPIPPDVARMLQSVRSSKGDNSNDTYFFWTGRGAPKSIAQSWETSYKKLFGLAGLKNADGTAKRCIPHMFRDTFAVESLLAGMRIEEVSTMLGHSSIKITEEHYLPWVRARQSSLNESVLNSWAAQGKIASKGKAAIIPITNVR